MTRTRFNLFQIGAACAVVLLPVASRAAATEAEARKHAINVPMPEYPLEARARHWTGSGICIVDVDTKTGLVVGARMFRSTGNVLLDHAAIAAFSRWRFKPGTPFKQVQIPIRFVLGGHT